MTAPGDISMGARGAFVSPPRFRQCCPVVETNILREVSLALLLGGSRKVSGSAADGKGVTPGLIKFVCT